VSAAAPAVALRPAVPDDLPFQARLYASTREEELEPVPWSAEQKAEFLAFQFRAQTAHYEKHYADASFEIVMVGGEPAGRLIVHRWEGEIRIVDIALMPEARGRGIGTRLIAPLLDEGVEAGADVTIHVERMNPAMRLYERLGFEPAGDEGVYVKMSRPPGRGPQAKIAS
jgi:ribosomal protein S18 acetylase RimI-like enzyme